MNAELEEDLKAEGGGMLPFVESLRRTHAAHVSPGFAGGVMARIKLRKRFARMCPTAFAAAASVAAAIALAALMDGAGTPSSREPSEKNLVACQRADGSFTASSAAPYVQAFAVGALANCGVRGDAALRLAVDALVRAQDADGGWRNAGLSARNVAALAAATSAGIASARPAYLRGLRYLRMHGIAELSASDFAREAKDALARLGASPDAGLVCSAALASRL